jgi:hypothetical protein
MALRQMGNSARCGVAAGSDLPVHCGVAGTTKSATPCVFCGTTGSLSTEHVVPKWVRKALQISEPVREFSGTTYVGTAEALAVVFHEVCVSCNTGWMETLETITRPVFGPLLLGAAPDTSRMLDPDQQAILATCGLLRNGGVSCGASSVLVDGVLG